MPVSTDPRIGTELLGYRIEALLGRGGMGVVYKAYDPRLKRYLALKLVAPQLSDDERFRERFLRESELAASLDHPSIVPIYDAGEVGGQLYIAMRYAGEQLVDQLVRQIRRINVRGDDRHRLLRVVLAHAWSPFRAGPPLPALRAGSGGTRSTQTTPTQRIGQTLPFHSGETIHRPRSK